MGEEEGERMEREGEARVIAAADSSWGEADRTGEVGGRTEKGRGEGSSSSRQQLGRGRE